MKNAQSFAAAVMAALLLGAGEAQGQTPPSRPDATRADPATTSLLDGFLAAQTAQDVERTMAYVSSDLITYADATLGTEHRGYGALEAVFAESMPTWGSGRVFWSRIIGGPDSAVVAFTTTKEIWGAELEILAAVDLKDGKIIRWVDYFDGQAYDANAFAAMRAPQADIPATFGEESVVGNAAPRFVAIARRWHTAASIADQGTLRALLSPGAVFEDLTLKTQVSGADAIVAYLERSFISAPFSRQARLRHVVGGDRGGGYEWIGGNGMDTVLGLTAIELDGEGRITRLTTIYDGHQLPPDRLARLRSLTPED